jgi:hypothetical protein
MLISSAVILFPVAALAADVRVDFDRHKDFSKYRTFSVEIGPLVRTDGGVDEQNTLAENRLRTAVAHEFLARGIESNDARPHLIVRISGRETERSEIIDTGWNAYPGYWSRRWGYWRRPYGLWGGYYGDVWTRRYLEESLTIDVIERDTGALVYRAQVTEEVGKNPEKQVTKAVDKAFKKFPVKEIAD